MGAYDDLINATQPEATPAAGANAYADLIQNPASEQTHAETLSIAHQLGRGAGLSARALIEGAVGLPAQVADVGHSLYSLATDPQARSATWEQMKHPSQWFTPDPGAPSQQFSRALDPYLPQPQTAAEKVMSAGLGMEGGAMMPQVPVPGAKAPGNFVTPEQQKAQRLAQSLQEAQDAGFVVPPSTTNPTKSNRFLESIAGNENTRNQARIINQGARNDLAAQDLGIKPGVLTPEAVAAVKNEAGQVFQQARSIPRITTRQEYSDDLDRILNSTRGANADFPGAANPDVEKVINTYRQPSFTGNSAVSAVQLLRQKATDAYRNGQSELGAAYRGISSAIERETERGALRLEEPPPPQQYSLAMDFADQGDVSSRQLFDKLVPTEHGHASVNGPMVYDATTGGWKIQPQTEIKSVQESREFGPSQQLGMPFSTRAIESFQPPPSRPPPGQYSSLVDALRRARTTYAKASTIEDAMDAAGNVSGQKLAAAWNRGEPLSGGTLLSAEHAINYPKANAPANSSNVRKLSAAGALLGAAEGYHVAGVKGALIGGSLPLTSEGAAAYLLSKAGQSGARPSAGASRAAMLARALARPTVAAGAINTTSSQ
jgi:hypothetical protein